MNVNTELSKNSAHARKMIEAGRRELVQAVRKASASGMSQREIARVTGYSQPEINRLIRFHGTSENGRRLRKNAVEIKQILSKHGMSNIRVFGSTARGEDEPGSDIDLLVSVQKPLGYLTQARIEKQLKNLLGTNVDLVMDNAIRPDLEPSILTDAVAL